MTNEELRKLEKAYVKILNQKEADLGVWASPSYVEARRKDSTVTLLCQHDFNPDLWIGEHRDGSEAIYHYTELAKNSKAD